MRAASLIALAAAASALVVPAATAGSMLRFTVATRQGPTTVHAHPPTGTAGDSYVSSLQLVNAGRAQLGRPARSDVGTMEFTYTIRKQCPAAGARCVATADFSTVTTLPGGTVTAGGKAISISSSTITIPVTGGTGRYRGVAGTVTISPSSMKRSTYSLQLP